MDLAEDAATAQTVYQQALADQKAADLATWATSVGTTAAQFQADAATARADWIDAMSSHVISFAIASAHPAAEESPSGRARDCFRRDRSRE